MPNAAFISVVNRRYLPGFHTLMHSLRRTGMVDHFDVLAVTTEAELQEDPIVQAMCKDVMVLDDEAISAFRRIPRDGVKKERLHRAEIAAYWFLKLYAFRDFGYEFNVLLDCDILCLKPFPKAAICIPGVDIAAAPRFDPDTLYPGPRGVESSQDDTDEQLRQFWTEYDLQVGRVGINSGVTVIGRGLQGDDTYLALIDLAATVSANSDQGTIWQFINGGQCSFRPIPPAYNFNQRALSHLSAIKQIEWLNKAVLLHFPGSYPWGRDDTMKKLSHAVWHQAYRESRRWLGALREDDLTRSTSPRPAQRTSSTPKFSSD